MTGSYSKHSSIVVMIILQLFHLTKYIITIHLNYFCLSYRKFMIKFSIQRFKYFYLRMYTGFPYLGRTMLISIKRKTLATSAFRIINRPQEHVRCSFVILIIHRIYAFLRQHIRNPFSRHTDTARELRWLRRHPPNFSYPNHPITLHPLSRKQN